MLVRGAVLALATVLTGLVPALSGPAGTSAGPGTAAAAVAPLVRPNVVFVLTDDQTRESVARMPYVEAQPWVSFDNAFVNNSVCCPSRATYMQGRYDTHTGVQNNAQTANADRSLGMQTWLKDAGYTTGMFGKELAGYNGGPVPAGWDRWYVPYTSRLYAQYDYPISVNGRNEVRGTAPQDYQVDYLAARGAEFVRDSAAAGRPFFLMYAPTATHSPWVASPSRTGLHAGTPAPRSPAFNERDVTDKPAWVRNLLPVDAATTDANRRKEFDAAVSVDDALRRLDDALRTAGVYDSTVVILMTDNGYAFGDHRWPNKRCGYDPCMRTPMLVRYPGVAPRTDSHLVSNVDLAPTVAELTGARPRVTPDGRSVLPLVLGQAVPKRQQWRTGVLMHWPGGNANGGSGKVDSIPGYWAVRTEREKYLEYATGEREYYDLVADPHELVNRVDDPAVGSRVGRLARELRELKADADATGPGTAAVNVPGTFGADLD